MRNYAGICKGICSYNLVHNFLTSLLPLKSLVLVVHLLNAFWDGNEVFPNGSSWNKIVTLLVVFHLPYSKCKGVKIYFYSCRYQNQKFSLVPHSCRSCSTRVAHLSLVSHSCCTLVASVALLLHSFRLCMELVLQIRLDRGIDLPFKNKYRTMT